MDIVVRFVRFLKKLWSVLRKVLAVALLLAAIYFVVFSAVANAVLYGILCLGAAFLVDADTAAKAVAVTGEALGTASKAIAGAVGGVAGGVASGLFGSGFGGVLVACVAGYFGLRYLSNRRNGPAEPEAAPSQPVAPFTLQSVGTQ